MNQAIGKAAFSTFFGLAGGLAAWLFGGWSEDLLTLLAFMGVDFLTGLVLAGIFQRSRKSEGGALESRAGWKGLCRKGGVLLVVLVAHRLDVVLGVDYIRTSVIVAFLANEALSIIENMGQMGLPLPNAVKKAIDLLNGSEEDPDDSSH